MERTIEDFKKQAKEKNISRWNIHDCSMCGYKCGYVISSKQNIYYDSGCYCTGGGTLEKRSWVEVAEHYNRNQRENNPDIKQKYLDEMDEFWGFKK